MAKKPGFPAETGQALPSGASEDNASRSGGSKTGFLFGMRSLARQPSLAQRLATTYLLTTLLVLIVLGVVVYFSTSFYLDRRLEMELDAQADFYAAYAASLAADERALSSLAPTVASLFAPQADLTVRFFAAGNGALLAATQDIGPEPSRAALRELRYRSPTMFTPSSRDLPHRRYAARQIAVGASQNERVVGVVEVSKSTLPGEEFLATLRAILLAAVMVAAAISLLVSVLLARRLSGPIREMERATRRIAAGDLDVRLDEFPADEVSQLARSIDHMAARLKHLEAARAQFIGEVSHDLRTPLAAIKGLLVNLIDAAGPDERPSLEIAERETDRLIRLVNQLLDFSRWQGGQLKLDRQVIDVGAVAREAVALCEGRASHRGVALSAEIPADLPQVPADADRLQRVILNLLDNAIGFTPGGGEVVLRVEVLGHGDKETRGQGDGDISVPLSPCLLVSVCDTGRGMSEEERARAFEPYYRGAGGGAGLGLTIARAIVEAHGGQMGVESDPGQGSRVWFTLPL
ncbi:MAG: HAMP domain-containing histidine kinase [Anaerolineae bacterium]|nr:HAMP domain-containing histidine kinase [Anaerolineae bacterium]